MTKRLLVRHSRSVVAPLCLLGAVLIFGSTVPGFLETDNVTNLLGQMAPLAIVALGQMIVLVTRGFDISVGAVAALSAVVAATTINATGTAGVIAAPLTGLVCGLVSGYLVGRLDVQPIIATLGMLSVARGLALVIGDGQVVALEDNPLMTLGFGKVAGVPWTFVVVLVVLAAVAFTTARLRIGRRLYMIGSDPQAAELIGVSRPRTLLFAYGASGLAAGTAGVIFLSRAGAGLPTEGNGLELAAIAAAVIGGTALSGGIARPAFVVLGALFIQMLSNGLNLGGTSAFAQEVILGVVIVLAGLTDWAIRRMARYSRRGGEVPA
jgi:ribose transport system permease protein